MRNQRLGVFGGTFDPPHVGHQILAMEGADQLQLDQVLWVLTPDPPHKRGKKKTPIDIRIKMVKVAIQSDQNFTLSYIDINRPGPHYVLDMMKLLKKEHPNDELVFLMGGDSLHDLPMWYRPIEFIATCDKVGVMRRPGERITLGSIEEELDGISKKIEFIDAPLLEISSNQIRSLIRSGKPYRYYLPNDVYKIVEELRLYREVGSK
jgi:nicotinate-nucleotide adenylyltransferase